jgi:hypothetical protein
VVAPGVRGASRWKGGEEVNDPNTPQHYYGMWFVPAADNSRDFFAMIVKEDGKWKMKYRFRYYSANSSGPFDGKDEKHCYTATAKDDSDEQLQQMVAVMTAIVAPLEKSFGRPVDFVELNCANNDPKFLFEVASRPWMHFKPAGQEDNTK